MFFSLEEVALRLAWQASLWLMDAWVPAQYRQVSGWVGFLGTLG